MKIKQEQFAGGIKLRMLLKLIRTGKLKLFPSENAWPLTIKADYVEWLMESRYHLPIVLNKNGNIYEVVKGVQRIKAIEEYTNQRFDVKGKFFNLSHCGRHLCESEREMFMGLELNAEVLNEIDVFKYRNALSRQKEFSMDTLLKIAEMNRVKNIVRTEYRWRYDSPRQIEAAPPVARQSPPVARHVEAAPPVARHVTEAADVIKLIKEITSVVDDSSTLLEQGVDSLAITEVVAAVKREYPWVDDEKVRYGSPKEIADAVCN